MSRTSIGHQSVGAESLFPPSISPVSTTPYRLTPTSLTYVIYLALVRYLCLWHLMQIKLWWKLRLMQKGLLGTLWAGLWRRFMDIEHVLNGHELKAVCLCLDHCLIWTGSHESLGELLLCLRKITTNEVCNITSLKLVQTYGGSERRKSFSSSSLAYIGAHIPLSTTTSHQQHQKHIHCHFLTCKD